MLEASHWHPVASAEGWGRGPTAARLLGQDLVLWRDAAGAVQAWADRCPHRGSRLSLGRVENNVLACAYHGWQFAPSGQCVRVPALPGFTPPPSHCATHYQAQEAFGLVWVMLGNRDGPLPQFQAEQDAVLRKLNCGPYEVAVSAARVVENFLDMAHFGFVHEGLLGSREASAIDDYEVSATPTGLLATGCKAWQPQSNLHSTASAQIEYRYEVVSPFGAVLSKLPPADSVALAGYQESIALFICPLDPESCRVWFRLAVADFQSPDEMLREFQHRIFMQDKPILESQTPRQLPLSLRAECHTSADRMSSMYRRHLKSIGITFGVLD